MATAKDQQEHMARILTETLTLLCKTGLQYKTNFSIKALIGITLDDDDIILVDIKETVRDPNISSNGTSSPRIRSNLPTLIQEGNDSSADDGRLSPKSREKKRKRKGSNPVRISDSTAAKQSKGDGFVPRVFSDHGDDAENDVDTTNYDDNIDLTYDSNEQGQDDMVDLIMVKEESCSPHLQQPLTKYHQSQAMFNEAVESETLGEIRGWTPNSNTQMSQATPVRAYRSTSHSSLQNDMMPPLPQPVVITPETTEDLSESGSNMDFSFQSSFRDWDNTEIVYPDDRELILYNKGGSKKGRKKKYTSQMLEKAVKDCQTGRLRLTAAAKIYNIPYSVLCTHAQVKKYRVPAQKEKSGHPSTYKNYSPLKLQQAVEECRTGRMFMSQASKFFGIPYCTIQANVKLVKSREKRRYMKELKERKAAVEGKGHVGKSGAHVFPRVQLKNTGDKKHTFSKKPVAALDSKAKSPHKGNTRGTVRIDIESDGVRSAAQAFLAGGITLNKAASMYGVPYYHVKKCVQQMPKEEQNELIAASEGVDLDNTNATSFEVEELASTAITHDLESADNNQESVNADDEANNCNSGSAYEQSEFHSTNSTNENEIQEEFENEPNQNEDEQYAKDAVISEQISKNDLHKAIDACELKNVGVDEASECFGVSRHALELHLKRRSQIDSAVTDAVRAVLIWNKSIQEASTAYNVPVEEIVEELTDTGHTVESVGGVPSLVGKSGLGDNEDNPVSL